MIGELIQFLFSLIFTILRSMLTSRVITILFLFFLFLVSLGAAEEKQMKNGKVNTVHQHKTGSRQGFSHSVRKMSSASNVLNLPKPVRKSSHSSRFNLLSTLPTIVIILYIGYSVLSASSLPRKSHVASIGHTVESSYKSLYNSVNHLLGIVKNALASLGASLFSLFNTLLDFFRSLDVNQYILIFKAFYSKMPVTAVICLVTISIISFLLIVLSIYIFCKLFLFISDKPNSMSVVNDSASTASVHVQRRQSIVSEHKRPRKTLSPYPPNPIEEPFSLQPFSNLRRLCVSPTSQLNYNTFVQCFLRSHSLSHNQSAMLSSTLFSLDTTPSIRTPQPTLFSSKSETDRNEFPTNPPSTTQETIPAVPKTPIRENSDSHTPIVIDTPESKPKEVSSVGNDWKEELMGNMDPELFASIMRDVDQITSETTMSVTEASNTMKQGIFTGSRGVSGSLGVPAISGAAGTTSAPRSPRPPGRCRGWR